jgi:hypothetical protein
MFWRILKMSKDNLICPIYNLRLYILSVDGAGILELKLNDGKIVPIYLKGRHIKVLIMYNKTLLADKYLENEAARGWLTNEQVAQKYDESYPKAVAPEPSVFATYRSQINRAIKKELSQRNQAGNIPSIFSSEKNVGTRLIRELDIIDLSKRV